MFYILSDLEEKKLDPTEINQYCKDNNLVVLHQYIANSPKTRYRYVFENGIEREFNTIQAAIFESLTGNKRISGGPLNYIKKDIYEGFNHGLGMEVRGRSHHKQLLKERGLVEAGHDKPVQKPVDKPCVTDEQIKAAVESGANIGGVAIDAIKSGKTLHVPIGEN
jgi:hypothetical protein